MVARAVVGGGVLLFGLGVVLAWLGLLLRWWSFGTHRYREFAASRARLIPYVW